MGNWDPKGTYKFAIVCLFVVQFLRIIGILFTAYMSYDALLVKQVDSLNFDPAQTDEYSTQGHELFATTTTESSDHIAADDPSEILRSPGDVDEDIPVTDWFALCVPVLEVFTSMSIIFSIMGPLSAGIPKMRWLRWLARLRIVWMRMLWTLTAVVYVVLYSGYRQARYESKYDPSYKDNIFEKSRMWFIVLEYAMLGTLECAMKVYTLDRLEERISKADKHMTSIWGKFTVITYLVCCATYAVRNFSMSLYFGLLSVFVTQNEQNYIEGTSLVGVFNVIVVLQIYLALMRGKYFNFFIRLCFAYYLSEAEDFKFITHDEQEVKEENPNHHFVAVEMDNGNNTNREQSELLQLQGIENQ